MYAILDIESSGSKFQKEAIMEIAIYRFDGKEVIDQFISLINPEQKIDDYVQKLTGITDKMVKTAPKFHEVAKRIIEITENAILVGHNVTYDYKILKRTFLSLGFDFQAKIIDTFPLSKKLLPNQTAYSLSKLCKELGIPVTDVHRASGDARANVELFKILLEKDIYKDIIKHSIITESEIQTVKQWEILLKSIPHKMGVFYFFDEVGNIIYVGKSKNIATKILKISTSNATTNLQIQSKVKKINYELTATELITYLKFKNEIKNIKPIFNSESIEKIRNYFINITTENEENKIVILRKSDDNTFVSYRTYSEAKSAQRFIELSLHNQLYNKFELSISEDFLLIDRGKARNEKSFVAIKSNRIIGYGFYQVYKQIETWEKIEQLMISVESAEDDYEELKSNYYRGKFREIKIIN